MLQGAHRCLNNIGGAGQINWLASCIFQHPWQQVLSNTQNIQQEQPHILCTDVQHHRVDVWVPLRRPQLCKLHFSTVTSCLGDHKTHETIILRPEARSEHTAPSTASQLGEARPTTTMQLANAPAGKSDVICVSRSYALHSSVLYVNGGSNLPLRGVPSFAVVAWRNAATAWFENNRLRLNEHWRCPLRCSQGVSVADQMRMQQTAGINEDSTIRLRSAGWMHCRLGRVATLDCHACTLHAQPA